MRKHTPIEKLSDNRHCSSYSGNRMIRNIARTGVAAAVTVAGIFAVYKCTVGRNVSADTDFLKNANIDDLCGVAGTIEYYYDIDGNVSYEINIPGIVNDPNIEAFSYDVRCVDRSIAGCNGSAMTSISFSNSMTERTDLYDLLSNDANEGFECASITYMLKDVEIDVKIGYKDGSTESDTLGFYAKETPATDITPDGNEFTYSANCIFCYSVNKVDPETKKLIDSQISGSWIYLYEDGAPASDYEEPAETSSVASTEAPDTTPSASSTASGDAAVTSGDQTQASVAPDTAADTTAAPSTESSASTSESTEDPSIGRYVYDMGEFWLPEFDEFYQFGSDYDVGILLPKSGKIFDIDKGEEDEVGFADYTIHYGDSAMCISADCIVDNAIIETSEDSLYLILILGQGGDVEETVVYEFTDGDVHAIERYDYANYNFAHLK